MNKETKTDILKRNHPKIISMIAQKYSYATISSYLENMEGVKITSNQLSKFISNNKRKNKIKPSVEDDEPIELYLNNQRYAILSRTNSTYHFSYVSEYKGDKVHKEGIYYSFPYFLDNLLTEGPNFRNDAEGFGTKDKFLIFKQMSDTYGALSTVPLNKKIIKFGFVPQLYSHTFIDIKNIVLDIPEVIIEKKRNNKVFSGETKMSKLSGAQPKISIVFEGSKKVIRLQKDNEFSNAMLKVDNLDFQDLNLIENMLLFFAKYELGFEVSNAFVVIDNQEEKGFIGQKQSHLVVERFDRTKLSPLIEAYEALTLLGISTKHKYDIEMSAMFGKLKEVLPRDDVDKLAQQLFFSYLVGNGDHHAKNISVIKTENGYRLSPLYDVVTTRVYPKLDSDDIAMTINGSNKISKKEFVEFLSPFCQNGEKSLLKIAEIVNKKLIKYVQCTPFEENVQKSLIKLYEKNMR